jgi:hypothetical protein
MREYKHFNGVALFHFPQHVNKPTEANHETATCAFQTNLLNLVEISKIAIGISLGWRSNNSKGDHNVARCEPAFKFDPS